MGKYIPVEPEKWAEMVKAQAEVARLEALTSEMDKTINASQSECRRLKAEVERLNTGIQPEGSNDAVGRAVNVLLEKEKEIARLKAEVERLTSDIQMEKENEDRLVREWQRANNEVYGLQRQVAALIDDQTRLKAECQARQAENSVLAVECDSLKAEVERLTLHIELDEVDRRNGLCCDAKYRFQELEEQVERLTKAGDAMKFDCLNYLRELNKRPFWFPLLSELEVNHKSVQAWNAAKKGGQP